VSLRIYPAICATVVVLLLASSTLAQKIHTAGYLPHWEMDSGYLDGSFEDQAPLLDEITYFGEFRFRPDGTIAVGNNGAGGTGGSAILNMPNVNDSGTWTLNTSDSRISRMADAYNKVASVSPSSRTTFTIGGWENSTNFHVFTDGTGAGSKADFAAQQVRKILDLSGGKLSGIDLDWEDGCSIANCPLMESNSGSYDNLTTAIRNVLQAGETQTVFIQDFRYNAGAAVINNIDALRLATYDAPHADPSGHHTSLVAAQTIVNGWADQGFDKSKLGIGVGFFARPLANPWSGTDTYAVRDAVHQNNTGQWLADPAITYQGWGFDGPGSIQDKADFIRQENLHTLFGWELGHDNFSTELDSLGRSHYLALTQAMHDATVFVEPIPGDFDDSGVVDGADLTQWESDYGVNGDSDADGDSDSDGFDFLVWQQNLTLAGGLVASVSSVPEPGSVALVALGLANWCVGWRRLGRVR
jgi:GH18 family chitinase